MVIFCADDPKIGLKERHDRASIDVALADGRDEAALLELGVGNIRSVQELVIQSRIMKLHRAPSVKRIARSHQIERNPDLCSTVRRRAPPLVTIEARAGKLGSSYNLAYDNTEPKHIVLAKDGIHLYHNLYNLAQHLIQTVPCNS